ncbi:xanthine dehydrogenase accessory protein XdhC [Sphingomonas sp. GB1N7]|uniref:xanthine dehydrogenase accessory protein XdhC n=1 Tax=Parasphingomonas caseinilytica TaxID=3096158 RepID=UPI002FC6B709
MAVAEWADLVRAAFEREAVALVTVLATEGSAPRGAGTRMAVTAAALGGTIGGGALEHRLIAQARAILAHPAGTWRMQDYPLGPLLGQCCGGRVRVLVERLAEVDWVGAVEGGVVVHSELASNQVLRFSGAGRGSVGARGALPFVGDAFIEPFETLGTPLLLFGAGHVGRAIAGMIPGLPLNLAWFDCREEEARHPGVMLSDEAALVACAGSGSAETAVVIVTHDHALDYHLAAAALRSPARFVGLIGSRTKRARFLSRLAADGVDAARLACPIGLPGISGKEPAVIAVAALAQILSLRSVAA